MVKNLPAVQQTWVRSLGREDPLEKEMATHSSILGLENPMDRGAWRATVHGVARVRHNLVTKPSQKSPNLIIPRVISLIIYKNTHIIKINEKHFYVKLHFPFLNDLIMR